MESGIINSAAKSGKDDFSVDISVGDALLMKKNHPCGGNRFTVLRIGADFRIRCDTCGHELMAPRSRIEKNVKNVVKKGM